MKSLFVKKSFAFLVFFASQFFCFAAGKNVKQLVPMEVTPVEYRNIYLNWNNEGTPQFFSYEDLQNDVNALNYLISTAYAGYEDAVLAFLLFVALPFLSVVVVVAMIAYLLYSFFG